MNRKGNIARLVGALGLVWTAHPYAHTNFNWSYDTDLWKGIHPRITEQKKDKNGKTTISTYDKYKTSYGATVEYGFDPIGINKYGDKVHHLSIFNDSTDARLDGAEAALGSFVGNTEAGTDAFLTSVLMGGDLDGSLDGKRGYTRISGTDQTRGGGRRKETDINLWFTGQLPFEDLPGRWDFGVYIPFKSVRTENISWEFIPHPDNLPDFQIKELLIDDLPSTMDRYCKGLEVQRFHESGLGDMIALIGWSDQYDQANEGVSKVGLYARAGVLFPTSKRRDKDNALSIPLGYDGAWGIPLSMGMDLIFENKLRVGAMADILVLFKETAERRLRQSVSQSGALLSETTIAQRTPGNQLRLSLLLERVEIAEILSIGIGYQGSWRTEDSFSIDDSAWSSSSTSPANTTDRFQESHYHNLIGHIGLNWEDIEGAFHGPRCDLFYKYPLQMGKRVSIYKTIGFNMTWSF